MPTIISYHIMISMPHRNTFAYSTDAAASVSEWKFWWYTDTDLV
jgi:hypothetical protein